MRLGVVGGRSWSNRKLFWKHLGAWHRKYGQALHLVSGGAPDGADRLAELFARQRGLSITIHHARWEDEDGHRDLRAGFERNTTIANDIMVLLAFWNLKSRGTRDTIRKAIALQDVEVFVVTPKGEVLGIDEIQSYL